MMKTKMPRHYKRIPIFFPTNLTESEDQGSSSPSPPASLSLSHGRARAAIKSAIVAATRCCTCASCAYRARPIRVPSAQRSSRAPSLAQHTAG